MNRALLKVLCGAIPALCLGCSEAGTPEAPATEPDPSATPMGNQSSAVVGAFAVTLVPATSSADAFTSVLGKVYAAPMPSQLGWEIADTDGDCELGIPVAPFCDPSCGLSAVCTPEERCEPYPEGQELGSVRMRGLGEAEFSMEPVSDTYQLPVDLQLPYPPNAEGDSVELETGGGAYDPFTIRSTGIAPLALIGPEVIPLDGSEPLALQWNPASDPQASRIQIKIDVSHHGGLKGEIDCDVEDDGAHEIGAALIEQLLALGTAGFPTINLLRVATGSASIAPGRVLLTINSRVERALEIPGVVSCNDDTECDTDQLCTSERTCQ